MLPILSRKLVEISPLWADPSRKKWSGETTSPPTLQSPKSSGQRPNTDLYVARKHFWTTRNAILVCFLRFFPQQECQPSWPRVPSFVTKSATSVASGCHPEKPKTPPVYNCFIVSSLWTCSKLVHFRPTTFWLRIFKIWEGICQNYSLWLYCSSQGSNMFWGVFRKKVAIR